MSNFVNDAVFGKYAGYDLIAGITDNPIAELILIIGSLATAGYFTLMFLSQVSYML